MDEFSLFHSSPLFLEFPDIKRRYLHIMDKKGMSSKSEFYVKGIN